MVLVMKKKMTMMMSRSSFDDTCSLHAKSLGNTS